MRDSQINKIRFRRIFKMQEITKDMVQKIQYNKETHMAIFTINGKDYERKCSYSKAQKVLFGIVDGFKIAFKTDWENQEKGIVQFIAKAYETKSAIKKSTANQIKAEELKVLMSGSKEQGNEKEQQSTGPVRHEKFEQIKTCISLDIPVYLAGPAGSGKNHTLEQIAKDIGLDFYFTNSVQQEYKLTGFIDAGGKYHDTEFYKAFTNGGLFFLDEMDASIPEVLVLLNAAIANKYFEFPTGKVTAHADFRVVAAGNTVGSGADAEYTGRMVLDQATLDRFAIIHFDYDKKIELHLANGDTALVRFIQELRARAKSTGVRATFSYRAITMVRKLNEAGAITLVEILKIACFKGLDYDTICTLTNGLTANKYASAAENITA